MYIGHYPSTSSIQFGLGFGVVTYYPFSCHYWPQRMRYHITTITYWIIGESYNHSSSPRVIASIELPSYLPFQTCGRCLILERLSLLMERHIPISFKWVTVKILVQQLTFRSHTANSATCPWFAAHQVPTISSPYSYTCWGLSLCPNQNANWITSSSSPSIDQKVQYWANRRSYLVYHVCSH